MNIWAYGRNDHERTAIKRIDSIVEELSELRSAMGDAPKMTLFSFEDEDGDPVWKDLATEVALHGPSGSVSFNGSVTTVAKTSPFKKGSQEVFFCGSKDWAEKIARENKWAVIEHVFTPRLSEQVADFRKNAFDHLDYG